MHMLLQDLLQFSQRCYSRTALLSSGDKMAGCMTNCRDNDDKALYLSSIAFGSGMVRFSLLSMLNDFYKGSYALRSPGRCSAEFMNSHRGWCIGVGTIVVLNGVFTALLVRIAHNDKF
jgi:hypothetical protein